MSTIDQYNALAGKRLTRGSFIAAALAASGTHTEDIEVRDSDWLTVFGELDAAAADADISVSVSPYEPNDNVTLTDFTLTPYTSGGPTKQTGNVTRFQGKYDVMPFERVRVTWTNNNAGAKTVRGSWIVTGQGG